MKLTSSLFTQAGFLTTQPFISQSGMMKGIRFTIIRMYLITIRSTELRVASMKTRTPSIPTPTSSVGTTLLTLTTIFILTLLAIFSYTILTIQKQKVDSVTIDLAGRQRMLNQRFMNEILLAFQGKKGDIQATHTALTNAVNRLIEGGPVSSNPQTNDELVIPPAPTPDILQALFDQKTLISKFSTQADQLLQTPTDSPGFDSKLKQLMTVNAQLNQVANHTVKLFSRHSQDKISTMIRWELLIGLLAVIIGILLTRQAHLANQNLEHEVQERARVEQALRYRIEIENLVTNLSTQFIHLHPDELDSAINRALEAIGSFGRVDRSYVFVFEEDGEKASNTHEWCAPGIPSCMARLQGVSMEELPWFYRRITTQPYLHIPSVSNLPAEAEAEKQEFQFQDIQSLVNVPMTWQGRLFGFLGFDSVKEEKSWSEEDLRLLNMAGEIFVNAFARKRIEENLRKSESDKVEALRQSDTLKSALLSLVSHELRTPLTAIKASVAGLTGLTDQQTPQLQQEFLQGINEEIDYLNGLVDNLLDMSRVEAGALVSQRQWHLLEDLVEGAIRRLGRSLQDRPLKVELEENLSPIFVDGLEIQQVLINLLDNAIKYSANDLPIFIMGRTNSGSTEIRVTSFGETIPPEDLSKIFDRFYRVKGPKAQQVRGTGLGLAICKGMVEAHGGTIWAESGSNQEISIIFTLPNQGAPPDILLESPRESTLS